MWTPLYFKMASRPSSRPQWSGPHRDCYLYGEHGPKRKPKMHRPLSPGRHYMLRPGDSFICQQNRRLFKLYGSSIWELFWKLWSHYRRLPCSPSMWTYHSQAPLCIWLTEITMWYWTISQSSLRLWDNTEMIYRWSSSHHKNQTGMERWLKYFIYHTVEIPPETSRSPQGDLET